MQPTSHSPKLILSLTASLLLIAAVLIYMLIKPDFVKSLIADEHVQMCNDTNDQCRETNLPYQNSTLSTEVRVADLLNRMTVAEKIGQMALVEKNSVSDLNHIAQYGLGALMSPGNGKPDDNTPAGWLQMVNNFQSYSQKTRLAIPLLYGTDANHGLGAALGATIFPHFIGLGASHDANLVREVAKATAEEVAATGISWIFSPDLDVTKDIRWGRTYETFGSGPKLVGLLGQAYIEGLQSVNQNGLTIAATAKHYVGSGSADWGSSINNDYAIDQGNATISEAELRQIALPPFKQAIKADVKSIMVGLNQWNGSKITFNKYLLNDVLRKELGYKGLVFSDWYGVYGNQINKHSATVKAINAGIDMVMLPFDYQPFSEDLQRAIATGEIKLSRLDEAVGRILTLKFELGLFDQPLTDSSNLKIIGSAAHRELARQAVRESLVLLKNNQTVPLAKNTSNILVAGSAANNLGKQMGGWTVEWQGIDGNWVPGTTILQGIQAAVSPSVEVEYNLTGHFPNQTTLADIGIAIVGENPYSEGVGDKAHPELSAEDLATITNLKKVSRKVVVIIVSGRPLDIKQYVANWDAVIAAWLPGSEGQGVADVLFGDYNFTGTLPVEWEL